MFLFLFFLLILMFFKIKRLFDEFLKRVNKNYYFYFFICNFEGFDVDFDI